MLISQRIILAKIGIVCTNLMSHIRESSAMHSPQTQQTQSQTIQATNRPFDVIIVGGGPAGLSAALVLGRSRRQVLVCDSGKPRNTVSHAAHGFFSRDGIPPAELLQIGREQLRLYNSVKFQTGEVIDAEHLGNHFQVTLNNGTQFLTRKLLLATGVRDILPSIEGFAELWGSSIFHCPYCHGWEVRDQPLAIYGKGEVGFEKALMLTGWSHDLILCSDGSAELSDEQRQQLLNWGIQIHEEKIARLEHKDGALTGIALTTGEVIPRRGVFLHPEFCQHSDLPAKLGCEFTSRGTVQVNESKQTSVPGVYVAGDTATHPLSAVGLAATEGALSAFAINRALIEENLALQTL
jgi:thioredoxin reductase